MVSFLSFEREPKKKLFVAWRIGDTADYTYTFVKRARLEHAGKAANGKGYTYKYTYTCIKFARPASSRKNTIPPIQILLHSIPPHRRLHFFSNSDSKTNNASTPLQQLTYPRATATPEAEEQQR